MRWKGNKDKVKIKREKVKVVVLERKVISVNSYQRAKNKIAVRNMGVPSIQSVDIFPNNLLVLQL